MSPIDLTTQAFPSTVEKPGVVVVDLWAPWCAPCRAFAPIFERVSSHFPDVTFARVNVDEEPALAEAFEVQGIPTVALLRDGVPLLVQPGMLPEKVLADVITQALALDMDEVRRKLAAAEEQEAAGQPVAVS